MEELVSVIVTIYNVEKYLERCIKSIISQDYSKIEILLVDDGSTDSCGVICDCFSEVDNRIKVIHKENGGVSDARNVGLDICKGYYITFIDSDDWVDSNYITYLLQNIKKYNADLSVCEFYNTTERGRIVNRFSASGKDEVLVGQEAVKTLVHARKFSTSPWGKLYKRELFDNRRYPKGRIFEDIPITYDIFLTDGVRVAFGEKPLYYYFYRTSGISKTKFSKRRMDAVYFAEKVVKQTVEKYPELRSELRLMLFRVNFEVWVLLDGGLESKTYEKKVKDALSKNRNAIFRAKNCEKQLKLKAILSIFPAVVVRKILSIRANSRV